MLANQPYLCMWKQTSFGDLNRALYFHTSLFNLISEIFFICHKIIYYSHSLTNSDKYILWLYSPPLLSGLIYLIQLSRVTMIHFPEKNKISFFFWLIFSHVYKISHFLHHLSLCVRDFYVEAKGWLLLPPYYYYFFRSQFIIVYSWFPFGFWNLQRGIALFSILPVVLISSKKVI